MKKIMRVDLIEERKRRGWSQSEVANFIGTTQNNVSRWELGVTTPGAYFRTKLCDLFHKQPQELGLLDNQGDQTQQPDVFPARANLHLPASDQPSTIWHIPYPRNPFFTGRQELLRHLHRLLRQQYALALTQPLAISGLGGIGKTQIALEYAYQYRHDYRCVFWAHAATRETLLASLETIAERLCLSEGERDQKQIIQAVKQWFATHQGWLLILDNADDIAVVHDLVPVERSGHLLFTSRAQALGGLAQRIDVEDMGVMEGTLFLLRRAKILDQEASLDQLPEEDLAAAEAIAIELAFFPLALDQAGAYIEEVGCSLSAYLELYRTHRKELLQRRGHVPSDHPESVVTTWSLTFQQVEQANPGAADLLRQCAFLEPDAIPEELLTSANASQEPVSQPWTVDTFLLNEALEELRKFSLVQREPSSRLLRLHRLIQAVLKDSMNGEEQRQWAERAVRATNAVFFQEGDNETRNRRYLPQAQACSVLIQEYDFSFEEAVALLSRAADYLYNYALYEQAEPLYRRILRIREQSPEPEQLAIAQALYGLARLSKVQRNFEQAEIFCQQALQIRENILGLSHPDVADSLTELARIELAQGRYVQAEQLYHRALDIREQALEPNHPDIALSLNELGRILYWQGKYAEAEPFCQKALHIWEQALGPDHPNVARALNLLGIFSEKRGGYEEAESLYLRSVHIQEQAMGPDHYDVAGPLNNLADLYTAQDRYEQAEPLYQRALSIWRRVLGADHPNVGYGLYGLADFYTRQGKYEQAEPLYLQALHIWEQAWEPDHPDIATGLHGLANLYSKQGMEQAEALYQQALSIRERTLGAQHALTIQTSQDFSAFREAQQKRNQPD